MQQFQIDAKALLRGTIRLFQYSYSLFHLKDNNIQIAPKTDFEASLHSWTLPVTWCNCLPQRKIRHVRPMNNENLKNLPGSSAPHFVERQWHSLSRTFTMSKLVVMQLLFCNNSVSRPAWNIYGMFKDWQSFTFLAFVYIFFRFMWSGNTRSIVFQNFLNCGWILSGND